MRTDPSGELVEVVQSDGSVLDVVARAEMRRQNLLHRSVYVAVISGPISNPELIVHQRSDLKDVNPGLWDLTFGGVCDIGEDWLDAAERELAEEAGILGAPLTYLGQETYRDSRVAVVGRVYGARYDGPISFVDGEVQRSERVPLEKLADWLGIHPVCADSRTVVGTKLDEFVKTIRSSEI